MKALPDAIGMGRSASTRRPLRGRVLGATDGRRKGHRPDQKSTCLTVATRYRDDRHDNRELTPLEGSRSRFGGRADVIREFMWM